MSRTLYSMQISVEVQVDPKKPETIAKAGQWMAHLAESKFLTPPEGLAVIVEVVKHPDIIKRRD